MEALGGILALAAIVGVVVLINYLRNQATKALNQGVFSRDKHNRGQSSIKEVVEFAAPVPPERVITAVRERLSLPTDPPVAFVAALYLAGSQRDTLVFGFGNKLAQTFRSVLVSEVTDGGSRSIYRVTNWVEGDGIVRGIPEMELLANTIRSVAAELGASYGSTFPGAAAEATVAAAEERVVAPSFCTACGSSQLGERFCTDCGAAVA
jgi:hypothetical protein